MVQLNSFFSSAFSRQAIDRLFQRLPSSAHVRNVQSLARQVGRELPKAGGFESLDLRTSGTHRDAIAKIEKAIGVIRDSLGFSAAASEKTTFASGLTVSRSEFHGKKSGEELVSSYNLDVGGTALADQLRIFSSSPRTVSVNGNGGNDEIAVIAKTAQAVDGGWGWDNIRVNAEAAGGISGGQGTDTIAILAQRVSGVEGGSGSDTINVIAESISGIHGDTHERGNRDPLEGKLAAVAGQSNDRINLSGHTVANVDGGTGDDILNINAYAEATALKGGEGNDTMNIAGKAVRSVDGGGGNDRIMITAAEAENIRGGAGDDTITLLGTEKASVSFARGDGRDMLNISGETTIAFESGLSTENIRISREGEAIRISFADSGDTITVFHGFGDFESDDGPRIDIVSDGMIRIY